MRNLKECSHYLCNSTVCVSSEVDHNSNLQAFFKAFETFLNPRGLRTAVELLTATLTQSDNLCYKIVLLFWY